MPSWGIRRRYLRKLNFQLGLLLGLFFNFLAKFNLWRNKLVMNFVPDLFLMWTSIVVGETLNGKIFLMLDNAGLGPRRFFPWAICFLNHCQCKRKFSFLCPISSDGRRRKLEMIAICDPMKAEYWFKKCGHENRNFRETRNTGAKCVGFGA